MSIKAIYSELKWFISQVPNEKDRAIINNTIVDGFHSTIDLLSQETGKDYSRFKLTNDDKYQGEESQNEFYVLPLRTKLGRLIGNLEGEYDLSEPNSGSESGLKVSVINNQTIALTINQTIQQLIDQSNNEAEKSKLKELKEELDKPDKDWLKIKSILKWAIDFSEKLFFQLLPIILKHYGLNH